MDIRQIIADKMRRKEVTQTSLQNMTGILQHRISEYLSGKRDITTETLQRLLDALDLEISSAKRRKGQ